MIVPVTESNRRVWAEQCVRLWPHCTTDEILAEHKPGQVTAEFLYMADDEAAGFINLSLRRDYVEGCSSSPVGFIEGIYTDPAHQRKGIAAALVNHAKAWCRSQGCTELASDCELQNEDSRVFHEKVGFTEANRVICFRMEL